MRPNRFRPRLETFEDRFTPAVDLTAAHQAMAGAAFFRAVSADPEWMFNPALEGLVQRVLREVYNSSQAAAGAWGGVGGIEAIAQANMAMAQQFGDAIGIQVVPVAAPAPVAPPPPATDAGMTNTMPDPNAPNWVALGAQGLKTWDVVQGNGTPIATGDVGRAFYSGWLASNGTLFDSGRPPEQPFQFTLGPNGTTAAPSVIVGWQQGLVGMRPGGIRRLFIPSALGYGESGSPPTIPANADLVFEVKLVSHT